MRVLERATEDELDELGGILDRPAWSSPALKRVLEPACRSPLPRTAGPEESSTSVSRLASKLLFLAREPGEVVVGRDPAYRDVVLRLCERLGVAVAGADALEAADLEVELFLHLVARVEEDAGRRQRRKDALRGLVPGNLGVVARGLRRRLGKGRHGGAAAAAAATAATAAAATARSVPAPLVVKGGVAAAWHGLGRAVLGESSRQVAVRYAQYLAGREALALGHGLGSLAARADGYLAVLGARQGLVAAAARHGSLRAAFSFVGPALWVWFLADAGVRALGADQARLVPAVVLVAQLRLMQQQEQHHHGHQHGYQLPPPPPKVSDQASNPCLESP